MREDLARMGIKCAIKQNHRGTTESMIKTDLDGVKRFIQGVRDGSLQLSAHNRSFMEEYLFSPNDGWKGNELKVIEEEMSGKKDMTNLFNMKEKIEKEGLVEKIKMQIQDKIPKRVRIKSEHDGEWDYDKRWELEPFTLSKRTNSLNRNIKIVVDFGLNSGWGEESVDEYGAMVWCLCNIIEDLGIATQVSIMSRGMNVARGVNDSLYFEIKKPGEYITPFVLGSVAQTGFYRRVIFGFMILACDVANAEADASLGQSVNICPDIEFKNGSLYTSIGLVHNREKIVSELVKSLS